MKTQLEATLQERDQVKAEATGAMEALQKSVYFSRVAEKHCLTKLVKIYGDLVRQIREVQLDYPVVQVNRLQAFLVFTSERHFERNDDGLDTVLMNFALNVFQP